MPKREDLISRCKLFNQLATAQTLADAFSVIQGMDTEDAQEWISVYDRLPEEEGLYLVAGDFPPGAEVHIRYFNVLHDRSVWSGTMTDKVKWWMPIPNPPEGGQKWRKN